MLPLSLFKITPAYFLLFIRKCELANHIILSIHYFLAFILELCHRLICFFFSIHPYGKGTLTSSNWQLILFYSFIT